MIVPTHGRPGPLARLLDSLSRQSLRADRVEIIVVDDGSPSGRRPDGGMLPPGARLVRQPRQGPAVARNTGASLATGRLLAFVDDDCIAEPGWLESLFAAHLAHPHALLGGSTRNGLPENLFADVAESLLGFFDEDERRAGLPLSFVASNNIACARAAFARIGGFDTDYPLAAGEDRAFCRSWRERIGELRRVPDAHMLHCHPHDLPSFWRQQRNYGRGAALFHATPAAVPSAFGAEMSLEPFSGSSGGCASGSVSATRTARTFGLPREPAFYARLLTHYLARSDRTLSRRLAALPLVALSQVAVASGLLSERRATRRTSALR